MPVIYSHLYPKRHTLPHTTIEAPHPNITANTHEAKILFPRENVSNASHDIVRRTVTCIHKTLLLGQLQADAVWVTQLESQSQPWSSCELSKNLLDVPLGRHPCTHVHRPPWSAKNSFVCAVCSQRYVRLVTEVLSFGQRLSVSWMKLKFIKRSLICPMHICM